MPPKAIPLPTIERHYQKLEADVKTMDDAVNKAVNSVKQEFEKKRNEIKEKLNKFKNEEQEVVNTYRQMDTQLQQQAMQIGTVIDGLSAGQSEFQQIETQDVHRRSQLMIQIFADTHREMENTIRDYKEKTRRVGSIVNKTVTPRPTTDVNQIQTFVAQRKNVSQDLIQKLTDVHREIDKLTKILNELEEKESQDMAQAEEKCATEGDKERKAESDKFKTQAIALYAKR